MDRSKTTASQQRPSSCARFLNNRASAVGRRRRARPGRPRRSQDEQAVWVLRQYAVLLPVFAWLHFWSRSYAFEVVSENLHRVLSGFNAPAPPTGWGRLAYLIYYKRPSRVTLIFIARRLRCPVETVRRLLRRGRRVAPGLNVAIWNRSLCFGLMVNVKRLGLRPPLSDEGQQGMLEIAKQLQRQLQNEPAPPPWPIALRSGSKILTVKTP